MVADSSGITKCTLWENDIGLLKQGASYMLCNFIVREYACKKFISKAKEGSDIISIDDIGEVTQIALTEDQQVHNGQIVGIPQLHKYRSCLRCKARVEPCNPPFARCSKEDCQMFQRYDICPSQISAKLLVMVNSSFLTFFAYGKTVLDLAGCTGDEVTEESLLQIPPLATITYNSQNVITSFTP